MKLYIRYILPLFLVLGTLTGCTDDLSDEINDNTDSTVRRTVLVYMVAENSLSTAAESDLNELAYAAGRNMIPSDCNILVYCDNASQPSVKLYNKLGASTWKTYTHRDARHAQRDGEELSLAALRPRALVARQRMGADGENQR